MTERGGSEEAITGVRETRRGPERRRRCEHRGDGAELSAVLNGAARLHSQKPWPILEGLHSAKQRQGHKHRRQEGESNKAICLLIHIQCVKIDPLHMS